MKNLIFSLIVVAIFSNCKTVEILPGTETVSTITSSDTTIAIHKEIPIEQQIEVPLPKDSIRIIDSIRFVDPELNINPPEIKPVNITKRNGLIEGSFKMDKTGKYSLDFHLTDSAMLFNYKDTLNYQDSITIANAVKNKITTTTKTVVLPPERYVPKIHKISLWIVIFELAVLAIWFAIKFKTGNLIDKLLPRRKV